jgi:hypothetical protein
MGILKVWRRLPPLCAFVNRGGPPVLNLAGRFVSGRGLVPPSAPAKSASKMLGNPGLDPLAVSPLKIGNQQ